MENKIANIKDESIKIITQAENQIKMQTGKDVVLIAYEKTDK